MPQRNELISPLSSLPLAKRENRAVSKVVSNFIYDDANFCKCTQMLHTILPRHGVSVWTIFHLHQLTLLALLASFCRTQEPALRLYSNNIALAEIFFFRIF